MKSPLKAESLEPIQWVDPVVPDWYEAYFGGRTEQEVRQDIYRACCVPAEILFEGMHKTGAQVREKHEQREQECRESVARAKTLLLGHDPTDPPEVAPGD